MRKKLPQGRLETCGWEEAARAQKARPMGCGCGLEDAYDSVDGSDCEERQELFVATAKHRVGTRRAFTFFWSRARLPVPNRSLAELSSAAPLLTSRLRIKRHLFLRRVFPHSRERDCPGR
jgi:hypothetical protein